MIMQDCSGGSDEKKKLTLKHKKSPVTWMTTRIFNLTWEFFLLLLPSFLLENFTMAELSQAIRHLMFLLIYSQFGRIKIIKAAALHNLLLDAHSTIILSSTRSLVLSKTSQKRHRSEPISMFEATYTRIFINNEAIY